MKKRIRTLLLLTVLLAGCAGDGTTETVGKTAGDTAPSTETETLSEKERQIAALPTGDYGGYDFMMLNNESNFAYTQMSAEELTGEGINDAIYNRNSQVAERLNVKLVENKVPYAEVTSTMNTSIAAGDSTYSCFWNESQFVAPFAIAGSLWNVHDIAPLSLDQPWWNAGAMADLTVGDYLYFLVGDLHLMFKESFWMVGFNKNIADDAGIEDLYGVVREGKWTMDKMGAAMTAARADLNGDGVMDGNDRFGVTCYSGCVIPLFIGAGETIVERDTDGIPHFVTPDDRFYQAYEKLVSTYFAKNIDYTCLNEKTKAISQYAAEGMDAFHGVFLSGHALFYLEPIGSLKKLRSMDAEFGVLPYPKLDEAQQDYATYIANYAAVCGIPVSAEDPERVGVVLENLCGLSHWELQDAYIKDTLSFKYIRDEESREMLDIIFDTGRFNLSDQLDVNTVRSKIQDSAIAGKDSVASILEKALPAAEKKLDENIRKLTQAE